MGEKTIYIASDHRGFGLKERIAAWLKEAGHGVKNLGPSDETRCDAQDYAVKLAEALRGDKQAQGILVCGTGQVMAMTSNRFAHIRAALCVNDTMARLARQHNDANVLAMGSELVGWELALDIVKAFVDTEHLGGRYAQRCGKLTVLGGL